MLYQFLFPRKYLEKSKFSQNLVKGIYSTATVIYCMIQIAVWMGFTEIYIFGADNICTVNRLKDGTVVNGDKGKILCMEETSAVESNPTSA